MFPKRKLAFDGMHPKISERMFKVHEWYDFYRDVKEAIPCDMPIPRAGNPMSTHCFVDVSHGSDLGATRRSQTGILIFCNKAPIFGTASNRISSKQVPLEVNSKQ